MTAMKGAAVTSFARGVRRGVVAIALGGALATLVWASRDTRVVRKALRASRASLQRAAFGAERFHFEESQVFDVHEFQRGNVHTHSTLSDGAASPEEVIAWYRDHGYQFLALTEHETRADPQAYRALERPGFVLVDGEEITSRGGGKPVHVNALCTSFTIAGGVFATKREALVRALDAVRAQRGVPIVNHPNYQWALDDADLAALRGSFLLEMWSGHPEVSTDGDALDPLGARSSQEAKWDVVLSRGASAVGVAVDDAHRLVAASGDGWRDALPGRGWIATFGAETSRAAICEALGAGRLYASNGAVFRRIVLGARELAVFVDDGDAVVEFVGADGEVLVESRVTSDASDPLTNSFVARYTLRGGEGYVRARVTSKGAHAWTQAYRVMLR